MTRNEPYSAPPWASRAVATLGEAYAMVDAQVDVMRRDGAPGRLVDRVSDLSAKLDALWSDIEREYVPCELCAEPLSSCECDR